MDSFEKKQILMQVIEYLEDYYLMHPDKKGELPDWSEIDYYNESYPTVCHNLVTSIFPKLAKGDDKILNGFVNAAFEFYKNYIMD